MLLIPLMLLFTFAAYAIALGMRTHKSAYTVVSVKAATMTLLSFSIYAVYVGVATRVFRLFKCTEVQGKRYLVADFNVDCAGSDWVAAAGLAYICMIVYVLGVPALMMYALCKNRNFIDGEKCKESENLDHFQRHLATKKNFGSIYSSYTVQCFYYDIIDLMRRLFLTGGLILIDGKTSVAQIYLGILMCCVW